MALIDRLSARLQRHPKRVVFPEGADPRVLQAARLFARRRLGVPVLLGDRARIKDHAEQLDIRLEGIRLLDPGDSEEIEPFVERLAGMPRFAGEGSGALRERVTEANMFATLMLVSGQVDALVGGATVAASSALRPLLQVVPFQPHVRTVSSLLMLDMDDDRHGIDGVLFMGDCAVVPAPTAEQLADIAVTIGRLAHHLTNARPRIAMLSFSSLAADSRHEMVRKVREATRLAREKAAMSSVAMEIEGELQVDTALDPHAARMKGLEGNPVAGQANILVFPNLEAGNIASKFVQVMAEPRSFGQILIGLTKPAAEISRGSSAHDIFGSAVMVAAQAVEHRLLYGDHDD